MQDRLHEHVGGDNDYKTKNTLDSAVRNLVGVRGGCRNPSTN